MINIARAIKASIVNPDRTTNVYYVKNKSFVGHNAFRLKGTDEIYVIDSKYSVVTTTKRLGMPFRYTTYYYKRNIPIPTDWPNLSGGVSIQRIETSYDKKGKPGESKVIDSIIIQGESERRDGDNNLITKTVIRTGEMPIKVPDFDNAPYTSIPSKELGQLLNPEFLRMISRAAKDKRSDLMFYISAGTACGVGFIIYYLTQNISKVLGGLKHG